MKEREGGREGKGRGRKNGTLMYYLLLSLRMVECFYVTC